MAVVTFGAVVKTRGKIGVLATTVQLVFRSQRFSMGGLGGFSTGMGLQEVSDISCRTDQD
jgi:hypothetical protein